MVSEIWRCLMILYWQKKLGDCYTTRIHSFTKYLKHGFSPIVLLWRLKTQVRDRLHDEIFLKEGMLFKKVLTGGLGMEKI